MQNQTASCYESNQAELAQHVLIVNCMPREQDTCRSPTNVVGVREDGWIKTNGFVILQTLSKRQNYEDKKWKDFLVSPCQWNLCIPTFFFLLTANIFTLHIAELEEKITNSLYLQIPKTWTTSSPFLRGFCYHEILSTCMYSSCSKSNFCRFPFLSSSGM